MDELKENLIVCKNLQTGLETYTNQLKTKQAEFNAQYDNLIKNISDIKSELSIRLTTAKDFALEEYNRTGYKSLSGGFGIRCSSILEYDRDQAFKWAKEHNLCLQLNIKSFEIIAKSQEFDFVEKKEKVTVTTPKLIKVE